MVLHKPLDDVTVAPPTRPMYDMRQKYGCNVPEVANSVWSFLAFEQR